MDEYAWGYHGIGSWFGLIAMFVFVTATIIAIKIMGLNEEKIYLTSSARSLPALLSVFAWVSFLEIFLDLLVRSDLIIIIFILLEGMLELFCIISYVLSPEAFTYVFVNPNEFNMYFINNKKLCTVFRKEKIYYAQFKVFEFRYSSGNVIGEYIVLSNEPFEYPMVGKFKKRYKLSYDMKTQIAMPYTPHTMVFFDFNNENWKSVI